MSWRDDIGRYKWLLIPLVLVIASFLGGAHYGHRRAVEGFVAEQDTVTKIVSVYKDFPKSQKEAFSGYLRVPAYRFISDTVERIRWAEIAIPVHDTTVVYLPREEKYYEEEDGRLRVWVSGYEPRLDRYEVSWPETTITTTIKEKPQRWGIGISGGYGAALYDKKVILAPYIGIGITYTILRL